MTLHTIEDIKRRVSICREDVAKWRRAYSQYAAIGSVSLARQSEQSEKAAQQRLDAAELELTEAQND